MRPAPGHGPEPGPTPYPPVGAFGPPATGQEAKARVRLVMIEAEGDLASVMEAIDALAEALHSPSRDGRSSERPSR